MKTRQPAPRSPARQALAAAIARHHEVAQSLDALKAARARAADACSTAEHLVETKKAALEAARQDHVDRIESGLSAGVNTATAPALNVRAARAAQMEAEDDLATLREALTRFDDRLAGSPSKADRDDEEDLARPENAWKRPHPLSRPAAFDPLARPTRDVETAKVAVIVEHGDMVAAAAIDRAAETFLEAARAGAKLAEMASRGAISERFFDRLKAGQVRAVPSVRAWHDSVRDLRFEIQLGSSPAEGLAERARWDAALAALEHDADAELPA